MSEFNFYEELKASLEQAIAYKQGDHTQARVSVRSVPDFPITATDVVRVRTELELSRQTLAQGVGVSPRTVAAWEAGRAAPSKTAQRLLSLLESDHSLVERLMGS